MAVDLDAIRARNEYRRLELKNFGEDRNPGELMRQATIDDVETLLAEVERLRSAYEPNWPECCRIFPQYAHCPDDGLNCTNARHPLHGPRRTF